MGKAFDIGLERLTGPSVPGVAGVLLARGYKQVERLDAADVILYNTCSIREKAAQKVFSRLGELRPADWTGKNRRFGEQTPALKDSPSDRSNDRRLQTKSGETGGSGNRLLEDRSQNSVRGLLKPGLPIIGVLG